jgi:hypothetical protein
MAIKMDQLWSAFIVEIYNKLKKLISMSMARVTLILLNSIIFIERTYKKAQEY